jgi:hypothetical protein
MCEVTVDSLSKYNVVVWDKPANAPINSFLIYRDTANNAYGLIGNVPYDSLSQFIDTLRTKYAANGDPNATTWKYKIAIKDTCGNISAMSPYHKTLFIQNNSGNFNWNDYQIEGQGVPVPALSNYLFQRDNTSNGNWTTIGTLSASSLSYTDGAYSTYQNTATWRVRTVWNIACTPTIKYPVPNATTVNTSKSNTFRTMLTAVNETSIVSSVNISPNPNPGQFKIQSSESIQSIEVFNVYGEKVYLQSVNNKSCIATLDVPNGIYFLKVISERGTVVKKVVINH